MTNQLFVAALLMAGDAACPEGCADLNASIKWAVDAADKLCKMCDHNPRETVRIKVFGCIDRSE